jgi:hypothetical protein
LTRNRLLGVEERSNSKAACNLFGLGFELGDRSVLFDEFLIPT